MTVRNEGCSLKRRKRMGVTHGPIRPLEISPLKPTEATVALAGRAGASCSFKPIYRKIHFLYRDDVN